MTYTRTSTRLLLIAAAVLAAALALLLLGRGLAAAAPTAAGVTVVPSAATQAGAPGGTVTYTLAVTNTGDATDIFTLTVSGHTWVNVIDTFPRTVIIPTTTVLIELNPNEGRAVQVLVLLPGNAAGQDVTLFGAVSTNDPGVTDSATLTTTTGGRLFLPIITNDN